MTATEPTADAPVLPQLGDRVTYADDTVLPPDPVGVVLDVDATDPIGDSVLVDWPAPDGEKWEHPARVRVLAPTARWWVSWFSAGTFEYHGPWWVTGNEIGGRQRATFCAAVQADDEDAARQVITDAHDDPATPIEWRFAEQRPDDWGGPFSARFPRATWMRWSR